MFWWRMCDNKVHFYTPVFSDAWRRRRNNGKLQVDNKKDMFLDEIPERAKSSSFDLPLEDEEEEYDIHSKHAPV